MSTPAPAAVPLTLHAVPAVDAPAGPPTDDLVLVVLHGYPLDHRMWLDAAGRVPGGVRVLAADLPGAGAGRGGDHGSGDLPVALPDPPALEAAADGLAAALDAAGVTRAVVAGLSMGGYVALALLERHPGLVAGLALLDTKAVADTDAAREGRLRVADEADRTGGTARVLAGVDDLLGAATRASRADVVAEVRSWAAEQRPASVAWAQRAMAARPDRTAVLAAAAVPVLVVVGEQDTVTPVAVAEGLATTARDVELEVVPDAGHLSAVEQPAAVAAALGGLVARVRGAGGATA